MTSSNALKTFVAGESIKAAETNSNNQYLASLISTVGNELQAYLESEIAKLSGNFFKAGYILALPFDTIPTGFLRCDGSSLLRADYEDLFDAIGTIYGAVDDYHFNLPDYRGEFLRGYGGQAATLGTKQLSGAPNIIGSFGGYGVESPWANGVFTLTRSSGGQHTGGSSTASPNWNFDASRASSVYQNELSEIRPENMSVIFVIKY